MDDAIPRFASQRGICAVRSWLPAEGRMSFSNTGLGDAGLDSIDNDELITQRFGRQRRISRSKLS